MNVAVYCRVSDISQNTENQEVQLVDYAKRNKWKYKVFREIETTRRTRPIKAELLSLLRKRKFDTLLIWKLDRWARSIQELSLEIEELYGKGINFISISDNIDLSTATGKLQFHILSAFAEFERNLISERTRLALDRLQKRGIILGRPIGVKDKKKRVRRYFKKPP